MSDAKVKKAAVVLASIALSVSSLAAASSASNYGIMKTPKPVTNSSAANYGLM